MNPGVVIRRMLAGIALLACAIPVARGETVAPPKGETPAESRLWLRELWVPADSLQPILSRYPRVVPLSHEQLLVLIHDADALDPAASDPAHTSPERAVLRNAHFEGRLSPGPSTTTQVRVEGNIEIEVFSDAWSEVPIGLQRITLGSAQLDGSLNVADTANALPSLGKASLRRSGSGADGPLVLLVQGRGLHRLRVEFMLPVSPRENGNSIVLPAVESVGDFLLHLPAGAHAESDSGCAMQKDAGGVTARVALRNSDGKKERTSRPGRLNWHTPPPTLPETNTLLQEGRADATVNEGGIAIRQVVSLKPALGKLPGEARFAMPPEARAIRVESGASAPHWSLGADGLHVDLTPPAETADAPVVFTVSYRLPLALDTQGSVAKAALPYLEAAGAHRVQGQLAVWDGDGIQVRGIVQGSTCNPAVPGTFEPGEEMTAAFVAGYMLVDLPAGAGKAAPPLALTLEARRAVARFSVDADARADLRMAEVRIERALTFHVEEGAVFAARVILSPGEFALGIRGVGAAPVPEWRQEGNILFLNWREGLNESAAAVFALDTRADFTAPKSAKPSAFTFSAALVPGAERLTGYIALTSAPALRLAVTGGEERLERRDGRTTPVRGEVAWFYRDDFKLQLAVEHRAAESEALFTGYALPLAGAVEIHGQINYHFSYAGVEEVKIRVPAELADAFFFTGAGIAERRRDGDVWTIRFQGEQSGDYPLGIQATIPSPADKDDAQRFHFRLPRVVPLECARWSGVWAVEANTDTEIRFTTAGVNETDALRAPVLVGYQPKRRVIGVFEFLGGAADSSVDLDGIRHPAAAVAAAVVDNLDVETVASTSGVSRHQATIRARVAGDGFFEIGLPTGARLWSLLLDGEPIKPVGGAAAGTLRVELPGGRQPSAANLITLIYETPGQPWMEAGRRTLAAPSFAPGVAVLQSHWKLYVPKGFEYDLSSSPLTASQATENHPAGLLVPRLGVALLHVAGALYELPGYILRPRLAMRRLAITFEDSFVSPSVEMDMAAPETDMAMPPGTAPFIGGALATPAPTADVRRDMENSMPVAPTGAIAPHFIDQVAQVRDLFVEAQGFLDTGRYDLAANRYSRVLTLDPTNIAARKGLERVENARRSLSGKDQEETPAREFFEASEKWDRPVRKFGLDNSQNGPSRPAVRDDEHVENERVEKITRGINKIILPNVDFEQATISDAIEYLRQQTSRFDPDQTGRRGVGIFLKLPASGTRAPPSANIPVEPTIPGLPPTVLPTPDASLPPTASASTRITLHLKNISMLEALKYIAQQAGLKVKIGKYAVEIVPLSENTEALITGEFEVPHTFFSNTAPKQTDNTGAGPLISRQDAKTFLESSGVTFPPGAAATYLPSTNKLVIRDTQENIDLLASLLQQQSGQHPANANSQFAALGQAGAGASVAGLLPLRLELPANGQVYEFSGGGEPGKLSFVFDDRSNVARSHWMFLVLGALGFLIFAYGWQHPWRRTFWVTLGLTFFPLIVAPGSAAMCNALLAGWLFAVAGLVLTRFLLRRRPVVIALVCGGMFAPLGGHAAPAPELVIVPYDDSKPANAQQPAQYYLPYDRFLTLWSAAKQHRQPPLPEPPPGGVRYALNAARYDVRADGESLVIEATVDLQTFGEGPVAVPLDFGKTAVTAVTLDGAGSGLDPGGALWVSSAGSHRVILSLRLPTGPVKNGSRVSWNVPPTVATLVSALLPAAGLRAEIRGNSSEIGEIEEILPEGRRLTAAAGGSTELELGFHDAPPPAPASEKPALAHVDTRLIASEREETIRAQVGLSFPGGTQNHFTVLLDRSLTLTGLDVPGIERWHLDTGGDRQLLEVFLLTPARDSYQLVLNADRPLPPLPAEHRTFPLVSADASRTEQTAFLGTGDAVEITLPDGLPAGVRRIATPSPDNSRAGVAFAGNAVNALVYSVRPAIDKRAAQIDCLYQLSRAKIELAASIQLPSSADGSPPATASVKIPSGFVVQAVPEGAVRQWWQSGDTLSLRFWPKPSGGNGISVIIYLVRPFDRAMDTFTLQPLALDGFAEITGETVIAADRSFKIGLTLPTTAPARDLREMDPLKAAPEFVVKPPLERQRAFRYRGGVFETIATLQSQPEKWQPHWVTHASVRGGTLALETRVNIEAQQGAVEAVEFQLPAGLPEARIAGPEVRETLPGKGDADYRAYRVLFQNPLFANTETGFTITLELPLGADGHTALPPLTFPASNAARMASGYLLVENASSGEMSLEAHGLELAVEKDVPFLPPQIVAGTQFFRVAPGAPWSLDIRIANLEKTAGRAALVSYAELTSTLRPSGEEWHRAVYRLQNRSLQFLPVELPHGVEFIGARVSGESVRVDSASRDAQDASLLVPLLKTRPGELSYDVELVYRRPPVTPGARRERLFAHWRLDDPKLPGVPVEKTLWNVYLPAGTRLLTSGGNIEPVVAALAETEKLESALSDLRGLSATYASLAVSEPERARALSNFNSLAGAVSREANATPARRAGEHADATSIFKTLDEFEQRAAVGQKQQSILRELGTLGSANAVTQQRQPASLEKRSSQEFAMYGPVPGDGTATPSPWRDNRAANGVSRAFDVNGGLPRQEPFSAAATLGAADAAQLALNDSLAVDISRSGADGPQEKSKDVKTKKEDSTQGRRSLSTARAINSPSGNSGAGAALELPNSPIVAAKPASQTQSPPAPAAEEIPAQSLRSVGRISLAVDFPCEGQVYHFRKIDADATLTLWTTEPARFTRFYWLGLLVSAAGVNWAWRRIRRRTRFRPRKAVPVTA